MTLSIAVGTAANKLSGRVRALPVTSRIGGGTLLLLVLAAIFAPILTSYSPTTPDVSAFLASPSPAHWLGTDDNGRDILTRTLYGLRLDLLIVLVVTYVPLPFGVAMGAVAGYFRGVTDGVISRVVDALVAFPFIVLVIAVISVVGPGTEGVLIGIPMVAWALYARLARTEMLVIRELPFMEATTALGYSRTRAILRHGIPNIVRTCFVYSTMDLVGNLLLLAGLSYLGLGTQPPAPELGAMIAEGQPLIMSAWWVSTMPGLVLVVFGLGVGLLGDGLSDRKAGAAG
jgi:peptide/nickel transport system permease protein